MALFLSNGYWHYCRAIHRILGTWVREEQLTGLTPWGANMSSVKLNNSPARKTYAGRPV